MKHSASEIIRKETVYDAGGGAGRKSIDFETLFEGQCSMFARTVNFCSDFQKEHLAQEARQITIVDQPVTIHINVAREDFPDITARIEVTYLRSASSQAWAQLLKDVCTTLKIDFIHSILDRVDKSPVHRIPRLRPGGDYLVRQRETSAILEVINTGRTPMEVSWGITMDINDVKQSLVLDQRSMPVIDKRVASLVAKPVTRETQREITTLIMNAVSPKSAVAIIEQFHKLYVGTGATAGEQPSAAADDTPPLGDVAKYGDAIDIISLHRLCLETLSRFVIEGRAKQIASGPCFEYVCNVIEGLRSEVDVVTIGLKLLTEVMKYLVEDRERVFHVILNCVQAYAPPESKHRMRNPKRLKPPEDQYAESSAQSPLAGYGATGQASAPTMMGAKEAVMPETHPSLLRYGDFYGHSAPCDKDAAVTMSENIRSSAATLSRLKTPEHVKRPTSSVTDNKLDAEMAQISAADTLKSTPSVPPSEPIALIRGRARMDKSAASHALHTALTGQPTAPALTSVVVADAAVHLTQSALGTLPSEPASNSEEFVRQQELFREQQKSKPQKYQFKIKVKAKGAADGPAGGVALGSETGGGDDKDHKKWKGSIGAIGRRAPEKPKEVAIDFKKKVIYDPTADQDKDGGAAADPDAVNAATQRAEEAESGAAIANALAAAASPTANKRKKKRKFELIPLALVPCVQFRGFSGRIRQSTAMTQSFATLYKMVSQNYGNRDVAFKMGVPEEISVIATVCQAMPRVLDYFIWIIDALYRDGFGELNADELDIALEDYTMVLSVSQTSGVGNTDTSKQAQSKGQGQGQGKDDSKSLTGMQFETISEMSVPSIDQDGLYSEATPVVNMGVVTDNTPLFGAEDNNKRRPSRRVSSTGAAAQEGSQVGTDDARDENVPVPSNQIKKAANQLLINVMGLFEFETRYVHRPTENIVLAVAMISAHAELEAREKLLAAKWLDIWDDGSRSYKLLKKRGMDLAGL